MQQILLTVAYMLPIAFWISVPAVRLGRPRLEELTVVDDAPAWPVEVANAAALLPGAPYPLCGLPDELSEVAVFPIQIWMVGVIQWCLASPSRDDCTPVCRAGRAGIQILPIVAMGMGKCACLSRLHTPSSSCLHMGACSSFQKRHALVLQPVSAFGWSVALARMLHVPALHPCFSPGRTEARAT